MEKQPFCDCDIIHEDVVREVREKIFEKERYNGLASLYKMFADSTRVQILHALECSEMCVCDLAALLDVTKSAVSHQLKSLRLSNLVKFRRDGKNVFYSLADSHVKDILDRGFEHIDE